MITGTTEGDEIMKFAAAVRRSGEETRRFKESESSFIVGSVFWK